MTGEITDNDGLGEIPTPNAHYSSTALTEELARTRKMVRELAGVAKRVAALPFRGRVPEHLRQDALLAYQEAEEL
ncbi:hypothetical protein LCGC14_2120830 [marine sediment metagenome]|uniref:Uncharacterized protein n=1 Tax=marine sediment metagenome TaxID=412755 RepID=A0A0F9ERG6_9ZZZZ